MEQQVIDTLNQYVAQNPGCKLNEKALEQIHSNAKSYDRLVNDQHYLMKTEITPERACVVQFSTEEGAVMSMYTFFHAVIAKDA